MATAGKSQYFSLDTAAPSLTDISAKITDLQVPTEFGLEDSTTLGDSGHEFTPTLSNGTISLTIVWDATIDAHIAGIIGLAATQTFEYGPAGNTGGLRKITGECRVQNYQVGAAVAGIVMASVTLQIDGAITRTTF